MEKDLRRAIINETGENEVRDRERVGPGKPAGKVAVNGAHSFREMVRRISVSEEREVGREREINAA
jgi:hypothetical protein